MVINYHAVNEFQLVQIKVAGGFTMDLSFLLTFSFIHDGQHVWKILNRNLNEVLKAKLTKFIMRFIFYFARHVGL